MAPSQTDALISYLVTQDAVDIVDVTAFAPAPQ
jgi:hypothetical protein